MEKDIGELVVKPIARMRVGRKTWVVGRSPLKRHGFRGLHMTPKRRGLPTLIVISTHLKPGAKMFRTAMIHEALHELFPDAKEKDVEHAAFVLERLTTKTRSHTKD